MDRFSGNHDFGGSGYHSYPNISLSSLSPYSSNCYRGRTRMTNTQRSSISLTTHAAASRPLSRATTPKVHIEEHKSFPQSPDVPSKPSLFTAMKSEVKSYITTEKDCGAHLRYELSWEDFVAFREEAKKSLPGWEKLSVDYQTDLNRLIIQCAGPGHEIMDDVFMKFWQTQKESSGHEGVVTNISPMGTAEMDLQDGAGKQPDFSFVDDSPGLLTEERTFPTTIFEIAYSESAKKLAVDCGRYIACSMGRGQLAIGIDIKRDANGQLLKVRFCKWELASIETIEWPGAAGSKYFGQKLNVLHRSDDGDEQSPATSFYCISRVGHGASALYYVFHAKETHSHLIHADATDTNDTSGLQILYRHMYREPEESEANDILYDIPYALLMDVIRHHVEIDIRRKGAVKRKELPEGQEELRKCINKRMKKLIDSETKVEPTASGSRSKSRQGKPKHGSSK